MHIAKAVVLAAFVGGTLAFGIGAALSLTSPKPQASLDPPHGVFETQETLDELFPSEVHFVPTQILANEHDGNVLEREVLLELLDRSEELRRSQLAKDYLLEVEVASSDYLGFFSVADAVQFALVSSGNSLEDATEREVKVAVSRVLEDPRIFAHLSRHAEMEDGVWSSPALYFFVSADNEKLGGGPFRRNIGGDDVTLDKERFNRQIEDMLQGETYRALGIGIDLNLEADEQGYSFVVLLRVAGLILILGVMSGLFLHSWRAGLLIGSGSLVLFVWMRGASHFLGDVIRPSVTTDVILPLAILAFGVDFSLHVIRQMREGEGPHGKVHRALRVLGITLVVVAITDATAFASNAVSTVEAVRSFGLIGGLASIFALFIMGICVPVLLESWDTVSHGNSGSSQVIGRLSDRFRYGSVQLVVIAFTFVVVVIAGLYAYDIERNFDVRDFFDPDSNLVVSLEERDRHFGDIRGEEAVIFLKGDRLDLEGDTVRKEVYEILNGNPHLARNEESGTLVLPRGDFPVVRHEDTYATQVVVEVVDTRELENVAIAKKVILNDLNEIAGLEASVAGPPFEREASLSTVTESLFRTLGLAAGVIFVLLFVVFRSLRHTVITLLPVIIVVLCTFALIRVFGFSLNFVTGTVAVIAVGIGVDYPLYIVSTFRRLRGHNIGKHEAIRGAMQESGWPVAAAAITSAVGFGVLSTSPMPLFMTYGIVATSMILISLLASIFLLPVLLERWG